jgi:hypothetical protein
MRTRIHLVLFTLESLLNGIERLEDGMKSTKRTLALIVALGLGLAGAVFGGSVRLLNSSFEDPDTEADNPYGDLAAGWGRWGAWINRESEWKPTKDGKCIIGYHHWEIEDGNSSGIYQDLSGTPAGAEFKFTVYASKDKDTNAESVELRLEPFSGGETLASKVYPMSELNKGWSKLELAGKSTGEGIRVLVVVKPAVGEDRRGCVKLDDADLDMVAGGNGGQSTLARSK